MCILFFKNKKLQTQVQGFRFSYHGMRSKSLCCGCRCSLRTSQPRWRRRRLLGVLRVELPVGETLRGAWVTANTWGSSLSLNSYVHRRERGEMADRNVESTATPLLHFHLMADVSCELNQSVFHSYVSASCHIFPSTADLTDFSDQSIVQAVQQTLPPAPVLSISP